MSLWRDIRCRLGMHDFTLAEGDELGAHQTCMHCGHVKRARQPPPDQRSHVR
jgi:hypothetical protein